MYRLNLPTTVFRVNGFYGTHYYEFGKFFSHLPETHPFWEMVYVDQGRAVAITNGIGVTLEQGQAIFHEPGELHCHVSDHEVSNNMMVVLFDADSMNMDSFSHKIFTLDKTERTLLKLFLNEAKNTKGMLSEDFHKEYEPDLTDTLFGASQLMQCYFTEFLIQILRGEKNETLRQTPESYSLAQNSIVNMICDYMRENIDHSLCLNDLCRTFHMGKTQLADIFHQFQGESPIHYWSSLKIAEAKRLLRETDYSIGDIADMLSYNSIYAFSRAFRNAVGFPPSVYRERIE